MTTKKPTAAEALGEELTLEHNGVTYTLPPSDEWDYEVLEAFEEGRISGFLKSLLGTKQHDAFKATKPKVADVNAFVEAIQKAYGILGN